MSGEKRSRAVEGWYKVGVREGMRRDGGEWARRCLRKVEDVEKVEERGKGIGGHSSRLN
jgi:hypothetical protein